MFRKMPFILLALIVFAISIQPFLSFGMKSVLYAVSLSLKSFIIFALPFLIFSMLFKTAVQLSKKASIMILFLLVAVCFSNFTSTLFSYAVGQFAFRFDFAMAFPHESSTLIPAWEFSLPKFAGNDKAMFSGLILGIILGHWKPSFAEKISSHLEKLIARFLKGFLFVIPVFIFGFVMKMCHDKVMMYIIRNYALIFFLIAVAMYSYIILMYFIANGFKRRPFIKSLKNMFPAALVGFGTMSSAAAMPLTILGVGKNSQNPDFARSLVPATVNIHLIGDCFAIPIFAFAVLKNFGMAEPTIFAYLIFALYFVLAKFSVAAVPGGGILVMLPVLESALGFNAEMLSLITALYILFDPVITGANTLGNGGFIQMLNKLLKKRFATQTSTIT